MDSVTILYWRDIPAQVIAGRGRRAEKHVLPDRFAEAIDRAAMRAGLAGSDDYLAQWRKADGPAEPAGAVAEALEAAWGPERLKAAALAGGVEGAA